MRLRHTVVDLRKRPDGHRPVPSCPAPGRFPGWQQTAAGEREVQNALRRCLLKYKLHTDQDLFDRAYAYIVQYY